MDTSEITLAETSALNDASSPVEYSSVVAAQVSESDASSSGALEGGDCSREEGASSTNDVDGDDNSSQGEELIEWRWLLVESKDGQKAERLPSLEFVDNCGLKNILCQLENSIQSGDATEGASVKAKRWRRCDCQFPHDIIACDMLHAKDETLRIGKTDCVRIMGALQNCGLDNLLRNPKGRHAWCSTKKAHDETACRFLHRDPRAVPVGKNRLGFLPEELVDNQAFRHLVAHPEHVGRWCTNVLKHEPKTCMFLHRTSRVGQSLGKRNLNVSKDGRLVKASKAFERKKRSSRVVAAVGADVPEFVRKQRELENLVQRINEEGSDDDEESMPNVSNMAVAPESPQLRSEAGSSGRSCRKKGSTLEILQSLHPALIGMLVALLLALVVQMLPAPRDL